MLGAHQPLITRVDSQHLLHMRQFCACFSREQGGLQLRPTSARTSCPPAPGCIEQLPKAFYDANFGDIIKMQGVISGGQRSLGQLRQVVQRTTVHGAKQMLLHCWLWPCSAPQAHSLMLPACPPTEVNAIEWEAWGLVNRNGKFRFPGFPPVAFLSMLVSLLLLPLFPNFLSAAPCVMPVFCLKDH